MNEVTLVPKEAINAICQVAGKLDHPESVWIWCDAGNLDAPA